MVFLFPHLSHPHPPPHRPFSTQLPCNSSTWSYSGFSCYRHDEPNIRRITYKILPDLVILTSLSWLIPYRVPVPSILAILNNLQLLTQYTLFPCSCINYFLNLKSLLPTCLLAESQFLLQSPDRGCSEGGSHIYCVADYPLKHIANPSISLSTFAQV